MTEDHQDFRFSTRASVSLLQSTLFCRYNIVILDIKNDYLCLLTRVSEISAEYISMECWKPDVNKSTVLFLAS